MYWRLCQNISDFRLLVDNGNYYSSQDFLSMNGNIKIKTEDLIFKFDRQRPLPFSDFIPTAHDGVLFARREVFSVFRGIIDKSRHVFYQATTDMGEVLIYASLEELSGFDFNASKFKMFDDGDIDRIYDLRINRDFSTDLDIFRLNDNFGTRFDIIVSDKFKSIYDNNNMSGLRFLAT